jgi:thiol-disulfide isomerase/thioredoxin
MRRYIAACFLSFPLLAQQLPDAKELLKQCEQALKKHRSYHYETKMTMDMVMGGNPIHMSTTSSKAVVNPDKMRVELKGPMGETTIVTDGEYTWVYIPALKQYTKKAAIPGRQASFETSGMGNMTDPSTAIGDAKILGEETIEVDGNKYVCWVVEIKLDKPKMPQPGGAELTDGVITLWIDKDLKIDWKMTMSVKMQGGPLPKPVELKQESIKRALKLDVDLPDSLFRFTPPEGAKEVAEFAGPDPTKTSNLAGKPAPEFRVKSLAGETFDSASLKGKVVLLDFWATWCAPCRKAIPTVEKIHQEFKDKGLVVLALNVGEERETVEKFLKTVKVTYPVALTTDTDVVSAFQVNALPTYVVITPDGNIAAYQIGSAGEAALLQALAKAGIKTATPK